jgi:hypothetical protein
VSDMIEMQQFLVADHIARLDDEAAALRAERRRGRAHHAGPSAVRTRLGHWLVDIGTAIAGSGRTGDEPDTSSLPNAA